ncbi:MAG: glycoside hydrolase family 130 protein [Planctomycetota bacterium]
MSESLCNAHFDPASLKKHPRPVIERLPGLAFRCPVRKQSVHWADKDVFNPGAVTHDGLVCVLFRAEDKVGSNKGTSRVGLATSHDGIHFDIRPEPVLFPDQDEHHEAEWDGGCEDPRVVRLPDGRFLMLYTAFNGRDVRLYAATSTDLLTWTKHGNALNAPFDGIHAKSGAVVTELRDGELVAAKIGGKYWMYFGELDTFAATSEDGLRWDPIAERPEVSRRYRLDGETWRTTMDYGDPFPLPVLRRRRPGIDSRMIEPGPPALLTDEGIVMMYHAVEDREVDGAPWGVYAPTTATMDRRDPSVCIRREAEPFMRPELPFELTGQSGHVCFVQGLVYHEGRWLMYYGTGDSSVGVAIG